MRLRAEVFDELIATLLYRVGAARTPEPSGTLPTMILMQQYRGNRCKMSLISKVGKIWIDDLTKALAKLPRGGLWDPTPFLLRAADELGVAGYKIALQWVDLQIEQEDKSPWSTARRVEWIDVKELKELFESESLQTHYGKFFEQRFIDYLFRNFEAIDRINWRKFEGLAAEFFHRHGWRVEIGPGRNDDGIDVRAWPAKPGRKGPAMVLVQCKRQKEQVSKTIVKALWADVVHEKAKSGLVVTTSRLSPGAAKLCTARAYPIKQADRSTLKTWLDILRSPGTGIFLSE